MTPKTAAKIKSRPKSNPRHAERLRVTSPPPMTAGPRPRESLAIPFALAPGLPSCRRTTMRGTQVIDSPLNRALQSTLAVLTKVGPGDMDAPTPCASWDVRALVNHLVGTPRWWAAVVGGGDVAG